MYVHSDWPRLPFTVLLSVFFLSYFSVLGAFFFLSLCSTHSRTNGSPGANRIRRRPWMTFAKKLRQTQQRGGKISQGVCCVICCHFSSSFFSPLTFVDFCLFAFPCFRFLFLSRFACSCFVFLLFCFVLFSSVLLSYVSYVKTTNVLRVSLGPFIFIFLFLCWYT